VVLLVSASFLVTLCWTLWSTPIPLTEAVALFEDVAIQPATRFLSPDTSYYRPLFHMTVSVLWHRAGSLDATLAGIKLLQIVPLVILVAVFVGYVRP